MQIDSFGFVEYEQIGSIFEHKTGFDGPYLHLFTQYHHSADFN